MQEQKRTFTVLTVMPDVDTLNLFHRIQEHPKVVEKIKDGTVKIKTTIYEDFVNKIRHDDYDAVSLLFMKDFKKLDLQDMSDYLEFYTLVPVIYMFVPMPQKKSNQDDAKELLDSINYLQTQFNEKLIDQLPTFLSLDNNQNAEQFMCGVRTMQHFYEVKKEGEVKNCFNKFDLDGNGFIDRQELAALSQRLGHQLNEDELTAALDDLDLNHDGTIDFEEFCRWYFTGLKPYNGAKRSMLQVGMKTSTLFDALKSKDLAYIIKNDQRLTKHKMSVKFNCGMPDDNVSPERNGETQGWGLNNKKRPSAIDENHFKIKGHILGPQTAKIGQWFNEYKLNLPKEKQFKVEENETELYVIVNMKVQKQNKSVQNHLDVIQKLSDHNLPKNMQFDFNYDKEQGVITLQGIIKEDKKYFGLKEDVPESLKDTLRNIEQGFKANLGFNFAFKDFLEKKSCFDLIFKGFKYQSEISFLRKIKKVMLEAYKESEANGSKLSSIIAMIGPLFSINSDIKVDLTHSDLDEILNHEKLKQMNFDFNKLLTTLGDDVNASDIKTNNFDLESLGMSYEKLDKSGIKVFEEDARRCIHHYVFYRALIELMQYSSEDFQLDASILVGGIYSVEGAVRGKGLGQLVSYLIRAQTYTERQRHQRSIHQDWLLANKLHNKYKDLYGEVPKYD